MTEETPNSEPSRILTEQQSKILKKKVYDQARQENKIFQGNPNLSTDLEEFITRGIDLIIKLEQAAIPHPPIREADIVYIDSGPGAYSRLESSKLSPAHLFNIPDKPDTQYHQDRWTRKMIILKKFVTS